MFKIEVKISLQKDVDNWWSACNKISYGVDWSKRIDKRLQNKIVNKTESQANKFLIPYLTKLYKKNDIEKEKEAAQKIFNKKGEMVFQKMEKVTNRKIYRDNFSCFITTFPCCPYHKEKGYVWLYPGWGRSDYVDTFIHELLHFQTYHYWHKKCLKKLTGEEFENLKEALTVVLNTEFINLMAKKDYGYSTHQFLRAELIKFWKKNKDFNKLVNYGIKIYPKFRDTIKYLHFGKYTKPCPENFLNKVKKIKTKKLNREYVTKVLDLILNEFNPKKYKIVIIKDFNQSRFISAEQVLKKRQRSCGSMATVVASVFRRLGVPTKLVDGNFIKQRPTMQHAWNEIYNPFLKKFIPFDITRKDYKLTKYHIRKGEHIDWSELEK